jgi:hypothetical protein
MKFSNVDTFEDRMNQQNIEVAFFMIQYHNCVIECGYSIAQKKFLFAFVDHNIGFTCSLKNSYAKGYINHKEAVEQLMRCRVHNKYDPIHFYEFLNNQLPSVGFQQLTQNQYRQIVSKAVSNFEDRIFFNHWRNANISDKQKDKTIELMGYEVVEFCVQNRLTPVFYPYPTERTIAAFENFTGDFQINGINQ